MSSDDSGKSPPRDSTPSNSNTELKPAKRSRKTKTNTASGKPVLVTWVDAVVSSGWDVGKADSKVDTVTSMGWLLSEDRSEVVLAGDISTDTEGSLHTNRRLAIPARWIKSIKEITLP